MSKEHITGNWTQKGLPKENRRSHTRIKVERAKGVFAIHPNVPREKQGGVGSRQIRSVCEVCNTGWMKEIQDETIPILKPMLTGVWQDLDAMMGHALARWATMTVMNIDASDFDGGGIPQNERTYFERTRRIPPNWSVWIGRCTGGNSHEVYHRAFGLYVSGAEIPKNPPKNGQATTVKIGQVVFHAISCPLGMHPIDDNIDYGRHLGLISIHPNWGGDILDWRYAPPLGPEEVKNAANHLVYRLLSRPV